MPAYFGRFCSPLGIYAHFHAVVKKAVRLAVIQDVEFHFVVGFRILDTKEEPLSVALRVHIILHEQVILSVRYLLGQIEISTFKATLKNQRLIILISRMVQLRV